VVKLETKGRLSREDWVTGAIRLLRTGGLDAIAVEPLAVQLNATKGSFYWHFTDRSALVSAVLDLWEREATRAIIERLVPIADPVARLRALLNTVFVHDDNSIGEFNILQAAHHPLVQPVLARVTATRTQFLEQIFRDLHLPKTIARQRAHLAYATYLGVLQLSLADPANTTPSRATRAYLDEFLRLFTTT
jgi:AcrR family transcriptional regulator